MLPAPVLPLLAAPVLPLFPAVLALLCALPTPVFPVVLCEVAPDAGVEAADRPGISCATTPKIAPTAATETTIVHRNARRTRVKAAQRSSS
jgi:hypothetical protein